MHKVVIDKLSSESTIAELNKVLLGDLTQKWGECFLEFNNSIGSGIIKGIDFDWGVSLIDYEVSFNEEFTILTNVHEVSPLIFFYISEGELQYCCDDDENVLTLNQYQNIIISNKKNSVSSLIFPPGKKVKVNFIQIVKKNYLKKKNNNLHYLNQVLLPIIQDDNSNFVYYHLGNHSLKIAEEVKKLNSIDDTGIIRTLSLEGQLNLVLAMQLTEHHNYIHKVSLPETLSLEEIKKIYKLKEFIMANISDTITIGTLSLETGLSPRKLQLGFQALYQKSVNVYMRELKLSIALDKLETTDLSVSEIVYSIGFKSRSYFSKIFFDTYGVTPTDHRKKSIRNANAS